MMSRWSVPLWLVPAVLAFVSTARGQDSGTDFFEKKVRPVLVQNCYGCHSHQAKKQRGGLYLDSKTALRKGGDSGPAVVPGKPGESLLLKAVHYEMEDLKMPPKGKLPAVVIADLERWVAMGAPDPRDNHAKGKGIDFAAARRHWAYQPIQRPALPTVRNQAWATSPIDRFILARLDAAGLSPSPQADRRTLIRRAYYDLIGLPPTAEEVTAFVKDTSPDAFARVVDHLLASPHYGERWGRHWLDVARYADTKDGVLMYGDDRIRPYAYTYRDYVIRAFNEDLPFDRFVHEQLAADQIEPKVEPWRLAALGYLTLGRMFDGNVHDVIDDQIDVTTRGFLGLTVACARCHDHKYDAVPTADYYSLYGVFASCVAPLELPLITPAEQIAGGMEFEKQAAVKRKALQQFLDSQYTLLSETARKRVGDYLVRAATTMPDPLETAIFFLSLAPEDLRPPIVARWRTYLARHTRPDDPVFGPWGDLMRLPDSDFAMQAQAVLRRWQAIPSGAGKGQVNPLVREALLSAKLAGKADVARTYGALLVRIHEESKKSPPAASDTPRRQLVELLTSRDSPAYFPKSQTRRYMSRGETDAFGGKIQELDRMAVKAPSAPPRAMVLNDAPELYDPRIFVRGNPAVPGTRVPRRFLEIVGGERCQPFPHGSGRFDLARAITAPDNPLTARVLVNRVWMYHFGEPLVSTPSDFGTRSSPPTHPELLDYLAAELMAGGDGAPAWSLKRLHRLIMLSSTYRQASQDRPECRKVDPDNRLWWRCQRQRLDLEAMRDTLLALAGRLDRTAGGRPVDVVNDANNRRRTVYGLVDRQSLPGLYRAFDFASPDSSVERRPLTTVPQQALFGMNSPFVVVQAKALAARPEVTRAASPTERVAALYRLVLARAPRPEEAKAALHFVAEDESAQPREHAQLTAWEQLSQVLLLTNEVVFVD
jgi:hypothetical protein